MPSYKANFYAPRRGVEPKHQSLWDGCIGAWSPTLGATGANLFDHSGLAHTGILTSMDPATDWVTVQGVLGLEFAGSAQWVDTQHSPLQGTTARTYSFWFRTTNTDSTQRGIVSHGTNSAAQRIDISLIASTERFGLYIDSANRVYSATGATDGNWHHLSVRWGESAIISDIIMQMDGEDLAFVSGVGSSTINTGSTSTFKIGTNTTTGRFIGTVTDVRIYNRLISGYDRKLLSRYPGVAYEMQHRPRYKSAGAAPAESRANNQLVGSWI